MPTNDRKSVQVIKVNGLIQNPKTNRWVKPDGKIGLTILAEAKSTKQPIKKAAKGSVKKIDGKIGHNILAEASSTRLSIKKAAKGSVKKTMGSAKKTVKKVSGGGKEEIPEPQEIPADVMRTIIGMCDFETQRNVNLSCKFGDETVELDKFPGKINGIYLKEYLQKNVNKNFTLELFTSAKRASLIITCTNKKILIKEGQDKTLANIKQPMRLINEPFTQIIKDTHLPYFKDVMDNVVDIREVFSDTSNLEYAAKAYNEVGYLSNLPHFSNIGLEWVSKVLGREKIMVQYLDLFFSTYLGLHKTRSDFAQGVAAEVAILEFIIGNKVAASIHVKCTFYDPREQGGTLKVSYYLGETKQVKATFGGQTDQGLASYQAIYMTKQGLSNIDKYGGNMSFINHLTDPQRSEFMDILAGTTDLNLSYTKYVNINGNPLEGPVVKSEKVFINTWRQFVQDPNYLPITKTNGNVNTYKANGGKIRKVR
jgi:hypothetical protein